MRWWAILYWVIALGLFGLFLWRRLQSRTSTSSPAATTSSSGTTAGATRAPIGSEVGTPTALIEKTWPAPPPPEPGDDTWRLETDLTTDQPTDGPVAPRATIPGTSATTLPELLAGITLPHELVPLTQLDADIDLSTHVIVATQKAPAEVVRTGLTDELERLGYEIHHDSMLKLKAQGPRGTVRIEIHPDGAAIVDGGIRRFPTAAEHSVVVELFAG